MIVVLSLPTPCTDCLPAPLNAGMGMNVSANMSFPIGTMYDTEMAALMCGDAACVSHKPDYTSLITVGGKIFMTTQFESPPSGIYVQEMAQDAETGVLTVVSVHPVDMTPVMQAWNLCAGSITPWNTHLGSEENDPDAHVFEVALAAGDLPGTGLTNRLAFWGLNAANITVEDFKALISPYDFGRTLEVTIAADGSASVKKWFTLGRRQGELCYVMPDQRTVYCADDGTNKLLTAFVADTPADLSSGAMYAMKVTATSSSGGGK